MKQRKPATVNDLIRAFDKAIKLANQAGNRGWTDLQEEGLKSAFSLADMISPDKNAQIAKGLKSAWETAIRLDVRFGHRDAPTLQAREQQLTRMIREKVVALHLTRYL